MRLSDLPAVVAIEKQSFPTPTKETTYRYELSENRLAHYQVLTRQPSGHEEQLIGYAGFWLIADEVHISTIAVDPRWRGHGLGELILIQIIDLAYEHDAALVTLEVRINNQVAQALYQKYEFEIVGRRKRYYKDTGEDALLMTVQLRNNEAYRQFLAKKEQTLLARWENAPL